MTHHPSRKQYYQGRNALVTGAASGIGLALSRELAGRGANVFLADINAEACAERAAEIPGSVSLAMDVRDPEQVRNGIDCVVQQAGRLDLLFNNAGISCEAEVMDLERADWERVLGINLMGVVYGCHYGVRAMTANGGGHIINTASMLGLAPAPLAVPYATSKFGVVGLTRSLRSEGRQIGIRATAFCPGFVDTPIIRNGILRRISPDDAMSTVPFRPISAERSARIVLDGVARNKELIVFPAHARLVVFASRYLPMFLHPIADRAFQKFRSLKSSANHPCSISTPEAQQPAT